MNKPNVALIQNGKNGVTSKHLTFRAGARVICYQLFAIRIMQRVRIQFRFETDQKQTRDSRPGHPNRMTNVLRKVIAMAILAINGKRDVADNV